MTSFVAGFAAMGQEPVQDSITPQKLEEVVVTGQFEPQSLQKSVYNVRVITKEDIRRQAANNLADVLNQYINITVRPSGTDGRSSVSMFGLDSQYFKIMVDNIPLVSDTGLGNNIDLTQINLDDIERIEIIEGSMGVTHGANAVSGILNIITKKSSATRWEIAATLQEETVGNEFEFFDKGRHIQALKISHSVTENLFVSIGGNRNDFAGFYDNRKGKDHWQNDGLRGYSWLPKEQLATNATISYGKSDFRVFYKFDYYNELVSFYNPITTPTIDFQEFYSRDKRNYTNRYFHHLNFYGKLFSQLAYNVSVSQQKQQRDQENLNYYILSGSEGFNDRKNYESKEVLYSTGSVTDFFKDKKYDIQVGYELVNENGFASRLSGTFANGNADVRKRLENYDVYASAELAFTEEFSLRPGVRYSFQSKFEDQYAISFGARYLFEKNIELRGTVGRSYRTPNFQELYTYFVDVNHDLQGNENLVPEHSMSYEANIKKATYFASGLALQNNFSVSYINVDDRIDNVLASTTPTMQYRYVNINKYRMMNFSTSNSFKYGNFDGRVGASLLGLSQQIETAALGVSSDDKFLYSFQLNGNVAYNIPRWNTLFSVYYKYTGPMQQFVQSSDTDGNAIFLLSEFEGYSLLDASVRKSFFSNKFDVTLGARNLLDIGTQRITTSGGGTGVHDAAGSNNLLAYGRSYFLKLTYNLNFN
ncbi:MAG: TonB-dependent receptor plug domain-containing protein [Flavobacterium sp.]